MFWIGSKGTSVVKNNVLSKMIDAVNAEVFTQKAGKLYPPVSQLLSLEKKISKINELFFNANNGLEKKLIDKMFWDSVNNTYGQGFFDENPQWSSNIFIPMPYWENILQPYINYYKKQYNNFNSLDFIFSTATLSAWRYSQTIFTIDKDIVKLAKDENGQLIDGNLLNFFSQWTSFIATPGIQINQKKLHGFFIHQNEVVFNGQMTKILILMINYADQSNPVGDPESKEYWGDYIVFKYELGQVNTVENSIIHHNMNLNAENLSQIKYLIGLFNISLSPKMDIYNHHGFLTQASYHEIIDSFMNSYKKNKAKDMAKPIRRGAGKLNTSFSNLKKESLYHVHAPSNPRLLTLGSNIGFIERMNQYKRNGISTIYWSRGQYGTSIQQENSYSQDMVFSFQKELNDFLFS